MSDVLINVKDFQKIACPEDAALCLVDPPYGMKKKYADEIEEVPFQEWVQRILEWSRAPRTMIFAPTPTLWDWASDIPKPDRVVWWHRTFLLPRSGLSWWAHSLTPILTYEREGASWYGPTRQERAWHDVIDATSAMGDVGRIRKVDSDYPKHPGVTGTAIATRLLEPVTREGDLVVDPMCGIGSILVAAQRLDRRVWGVELEPIYATLAKKWLRYERVLP